MINLQHLDLNLLRTLDVLLSENNVTRAAQRLNLSQPSVSIQLARLREIFADPLLMPGPRGMQPTARADELRQPLRAALAALEQAVAPVSPFDPATAAETWRVAATDYMASAILLPMLAGLRQASPGSRLAVFELQPARLEQQAASDTVDIFFHTREGAPPGLHQRLLFRERYVLAGRVEHPALRPGLSLGNVLSAGARDRLPGRGRLQRGDRYRAGEPRTDAAGCPFRATFPVYAGDPAQ